MLVGATCWAAGLDLNINEKLRGTASNKLREEGKEKDGSLPLPAGRWGGLENDMDS
jgi:hypothetical protein